MTPQPVGTPAYSPFPQTSPQPVGPPRGKFAADLRAALSPTERQALEAVFGTENAAPLKRTADPAHDLGRHIDVQA